MAVKKNKKANKYSAKTKTKKLDDVVLENSQEQLEETSPEKIKKEIKEPRLKKLLFKKEKLRSFRKNYGAQVSDDSRLFISQIESEKYAIIEHSQSEERVKKIKTNTQSKSKKKKWLNFLYFALNVVVIAIVLWVQLAKESNPMESLASILDINWWFILAAVATFLICMVMDQLKYSILIKKATGNFRFNLSYKMAVVGRHYDIITPLSTGGQPFQIFYAHKYGIKVGESTSIALGRYMLYQIIYFMCITFFLVRNFFTGTLDAAMGDVAGGVVSTLSWIGYACCAVVIFTVFFVSLNRRAGAGFVAGVFKLLNKIKIGKFKIFKDYKSAFVGAMKTVNSWQKTTKKYSKSFSVLFINIVCSLIYFFSWYIMPYFVFCAFNGWDPSMIMHIMTIAIMVDLTSAFNPIPMGIGTADLSFTVLYGSLFASGAQVWALIIWRILTYYIYIIQGLLMLTYDYVIGDKRLAKNKEFWMLPYRQRVKIKLREAREKLRIKIKKKDKEV